MRDGDFRRSRTSRAASRSPACAGAGARPQCQTGPAASAAHDLAYRDRGQTPVPAGVVDSRCGGVPEPFAGMLRDHLTKRPTCGPPMWLPPGTPYRAHDPGRLWACDRRPPDRSRGRLLLGGRTDLGHKASCGSIQLTNKTRSDTGRTGFQRGAKGTRTPRQKRLDLRIRERC